MMDTVSIADQERVMSKDRVTILGINGHLGHHAAAAFVAAGYAVKGFGRCNRMPMAGMHFVEGDAASLDDLQRATADADIVVNALNLPYHEWDKGRAEAQLATVIAAMGDSGKTLLYPGNIYNYAATDRRVSPGMAQNPQTPRGAIRVRQEVMLEAAARAGKFQTIILRAGDFFAPQTGGDWFDLAMLMDGRKASSTTWAISTSATAGPTCRISQSLSWHWPTSVQRWALSSDSILLATL
jgi:nucleoside-diphosphate-sugar epimerase